jgi:hypothetical protein
MVVDIQVELQAILKHYEKITSRNASKVGSAAGILVKPQKRTTLKVIPAPNV